MNASTKIRVIAALGSLSGAVWAGTFATFTDSGDATATFTAGTIDLKLDGTDNTAWTALELVNLKPGTTKVAPLTVSNPSSTTTLPFDYSMSTVATNTDTKNLAARLTLQAYRAASTAACTTSGATDLAYSTAYTAAGADVMASGPLANASITGRSLAAGGSEVWCFKVTMPSGTASQDNPYQGAATTATFTFSAVQQ